MAGVIATIPKFQFSANGVPMVGGTLETYIAGSTTPATTWQDSALTIANTNPISLDARGECVIWLDPAVTYKFVLKNSPSNGGVIQWTQDNISNPAALVKADLAASSGASLVGFQQEGTGAASTTVQRKLREFVSVEDFGAVGDGVTDDLTAIKAGLAYVASVGGELLFGPKDYRCSGELALLSGSGVTLRGAGIDATRLVFDAGVMSGLRFGDNATSAVCHNCGVESMTITRTGNTVPDNSIGLDFQDFNYARERNVLVDRFAVARRVTGRALGISIQYEAFGPYTSNIKTVDWVLGNAAQIKVFGGECGRNGAELFDRNRMVTITGECNDVSFNGHVFIPRGPGVSKPSVVRFEGLNNSTGVFRFIDCNTENVTVCFGSNSATAAFSELSVIGGRWASEVSAFDFNAATKLSQIMMLGANFSKAATLVNFEWLRVVGCFFGDTFTLDGGEGYASAVVTGNTFAGVTKFASSFERLEIGVNDYQSTLTDAATGAVVRQLRSDLTNAATSGYIKANGVLFQWGLQAGNANADQVVTFPVPFDSTPNVNATVKGTPTATALLSCAVDNVSATQFTGYPRYVTNGGAVGRAGDAFQWQAIGKA